MLFCQIIQLEPRPAHGNTQRLDFGTSRHDTAVIVGENNNRDMKQFRVKQLFATCVKVIAIDQGKNTHHESGHQPFELADNDTPDHQLHLFPHLDRRIVRVFSNQRDTPGMGIKPLDQTLAIDKRNDDGAM